MEQTAFVESRERCDQSCCSAFVRAQDLEDDLGCVINLSNPIHAMFAPEKFMIISNNQLAPMPPETYGKLAPMLRLVSRYFTDDLMVRFVHTMHEGSLHYGSSKWAPALTWSQIDAAERPYDEADQCPYPPQAQLTRRPPKTLPPAEEMRARSKEILENLAGVITSIPFLPDEIQKTPGMVGQIRSAHPLGKLDKAAHKNFPRSMAIRLSISASFAQIDQDQPSPLSQYLLARVILHEIGHVLNKAIHGWRKPEVFYQDSSTSESGFELENALFGGPYEKWDLNKNTDYFSEPNPIVVMEHWPSPRTYNEYKGKPYNFTRRGELDGYLTVSRISHDFIASTCTEEFWNARERDSQASATLNSNLIAPQSMCSWVVNVPEGSTETEWCEPGQSDRPPHVLKVLEEAFRQKQLDIAAKTAPSLPKPNMGITIASTTSVSPANVRSVTGVIKIKAGKQTARLSPELALWKARRNEARKSLANRPNYGQFN